MNNQVLNLKVNCRDNERCLFDGQDIFLDIIITNNQNVEVGFPLEFAQEKGPGVKLIDAQTKKESHLSTHLADWDLKEKFTRIEPGKSVKIEWVIKDSELQQFGGDYVDIFAEVTVGEQVKIDGKLVDFRATDTRRIVSKDKPSS